MRDLIKLIRKKADVEGTATIVTNAIGIACVPVMVVAWLIVMPWGIA